MGFLGVVFKKIYKRTYVKMNTMREISRLQGEGDRDSRSLANALKSTINGDVTERERVWIDKIESLRKELNANSTEVPMPDYGGSRVGGEPTPEKVYRGNVMTKSIGELSSRASQPCIWAFLLLKLVRELRPAVCLELGTAFGISTAYQAAALELNGNGMIVTLEGAESLASIARENFKRLGLERAVLKIGLFQDILHDVLTEHSPVDFAFIDGHHDERATLEYFDQIFPFLSEHALLVFDDISWSKGMKRAWNAIANDSRIKVSVDLYKIGICTISRVENERKARYRMAID